MINFNKTPLSIIVVSIVFLVFIVLQGTVFFFEYQHAQQKLYQEKEQYIKGITGNLQTRLSSSLMRLEKAQAQNIVLESALDENIKSIVVIDRNQQIVLSNRLRDKYMFAQLKVDNYDATLLNQVIENNEFIFQYDKKSQDIIVYAPLQMLSKGNSLNRKFNGLIFIQYSLSIAINELRYQTLFSLIKITLILLFTLCVLLYSLNKLVINPLNKLAQLMTLSDLKAPQSSDQNGFGEIGLLQRIFANQLASSNARINKLARNEQRLKYALSAARDGVWDWDIAQDSVYFSECWKEMIGYANEGISDDIEEWESRIHEEDLLFVLKELQLHFSGKNSFFESTYRIRCYNGEYRWVLSRGQTISWDEKGQPLRIVGTNTDVSHYKKNHHSSTMSERLYFDDAAPLYNHGELLANIEKENARAQQHGLYGALIFIECDQYKNIDDLQEHQNNDNQLLFIIAKRIKSSKMEGDFLAHLNTSQFVVVLSDLHQEHESAAEIALQYAKKLANSLKDPITINGKSISLSCSFGIDMFPVGDNNANLLLRQATISPILSNHKFFSNIAFFCKETEQKIQARYNLQQQLHEGLENEEFSLYFQPRVDANGQLIGAETLIRWLHSAQGWVDPAEFIPIAEKSGFISEIGNWIIKSTFEQLAKWQQLGLPDTFTTLSINVSPKQLLETDFVTSIERHLKQTKIDAKLIEIELTESILVTHKTLMIEKLNKLRSLGISFSIDNFGRGNYPFSYLALLPLTAIKLDRTFIKNIMLDNNQQVIVTAIINMAKALKLTVVAEGIESQQQLQFLISQGCTQFQGYLLGTPMAKQEFQALLFKK